MESLLSTYISWKKSSFMYLKYLENQPRKLVYIEQYKAVMLDGMNRYRRLQRCPDEIPEKTKISLFMSVVGYTHLLASTIQGIEELTDTEFDDLEK